MQRNGNSEVQLTDALQHLAGRSDVYAMKLQGTEYDAGNRLGLLMANVAYALRDEELRDSVWTFLKSLNRP